MNYMIRKNSYCLECERFCKEVVVIFYKNQSFAASMYLCKDCMKKLDELSKNAMKDIKDK